MSDLDLIEITVDKTNITLSGVVPSTPAQLSDLSDVPIDTGWGVSNFTETKGLDASNTTLNEVADSHATLVQKLIDAGILNA